MPRTLSSLRAALGGREPLATRLALAGLLLVGLLYFWHLDANLINDDEGSYLYAAWRISLGELPYRDFLTPQLPAFLMPGGWIMRLTGPETWPLRALSALFSLATAGLTFLTARRLFGGGVALVAGLAFALHPMVFEFGRYYRAEPPMLFFAALGTWAFVRAVFPQGGGLQRSSAGHGRQALPGVLSEPEPAEASRPWLALAGLAFGLAILSKLFGALPLAGCGLWLLVDGLRRRRWLPMLVDGAILSLSAAISAGLPLLWFRSISDRVEEAVLEHHLMQGAEQSALRNLGDALELYHQFVDLNQGGLLLFTGLAMALLAWRRADRRVLIFACQIVGLAGFVLLSRELFVRHLMYVLPSLATLMGLALVPLIARGGPASGGLDPRGAPESSDVQLGRYLAAGLMAALALPWLYANVVLGLDTETATGQLADLVALVTEPEDIVFGDFSEINFYAQRPSTYEGASMSAGAASSGQLAWRVVSQRFTESRPRLLVNLSAADHDVGHLSHMPDYADYLAWIDQHYVELGAFERDWQRFTLYEPREAPLPRLARFADGPHLLAARPAAERVAAGQTVEVLSAWQNQPPEEPGTEYVATLRLIDPMGRQWAQWDSSLFAYPDRKSPKWAPRELASQRLHLTVPADAAPGRYRLELGMYRRNGDDVPQVDEAGAPFWGRALAGTIEVTPGPLRDIPEDAPVDARLDIRIGGLTLLGRGPLPAEPVAAGETVALDLWWRRERAAGEAPAAAVWTGTTEDAADREAHAEQRHDPEAWTGLRQAWPLASNTPDDPDSARPMVFHQRLHLAIPMDAAPGPSQALLALLSAGGDPLAPGLVALGPISIAPASEQPPSADPGGDGDLGPRISAVTGDLAHLQAYQRPERAAAGESVQVRLAWRALRRSEAPWWISLQLLDAQGHPAAQRDLPAGSWERPSTDWLAGEWLEQALSLDLPADLPPGDHALVLALYNPATGHRLPVAGPEAAGDLVRLGPLLVTAP